MRRLVSLLIELIMSGNNLLSEKSPPPITFPALAVDILFLNLNF